MLRVTINGLTREFPEGCSILDALNRIGISVPTACHDARLKPYGGCRLCIVAVDGQPRPVTACTAPLADGMSIETHSEAVERERRTLLRMLAERLPPDGPHKELYGYLREYGLESELKGERRPELLDDSHPFIRVDMSQCITCFRCVRICNEVQGQFVWQVWNRGDATRILPDSGTTLLESTCVSCGACADTCPTGALEDKSVLERGVPTRWTRTTCAYCGVGCEMDVGTRDGRVVQVAPSLEGPSNRGHLCAKGRYAFDFVHSPDRVTEPMIRYRGRWRRASWDEAIAFVADGLSRCAPESVAVLGSARATNEDNYVAQKFARIVLGTHNVDCCARVCHAPSAAALRQALGTGAATNSFDDIEQAHTLLVCGSNTTENHPVVGARIRQQALRGANLIVIDPRRTELADIATVHLPARPGTNVPLLNAMAAVIVEEQLHDASRLEGWEEYRDFIRRWTPASAAATCGVEASLIRRAARLYATAKPSMIVHGLGMTEHVQGTDGVLCLINLALLTGNLGKPGTGINPMRGQNNVQGAAHMGCEPNHLTGFVPIAEGRQLFQTVWNVRLPELPGLDLMQMIDAAAEGRLKALWAIGYDVLLTNPDADVTSRALRSVPLVVVQDLFLNETAREAASVFLPACSSFEKDGTFMNAERRVQRVRRAIEPVGSSRPDWEILCRVAGAMGHAESFPYRSPEEIWEEIRRVWRAGAGITYARLGGPGLQWPCTEERHPGTPVLHRDARAPLRRVSHAPTAERATPDFPFLLTTGRALFQFNAGTMTRRTPLTVLRPADMLDVSPRDAAGLGLSAGEFVRVCSRHGEVHIAVSINAMMRPGEVFATFTTPEAFVNRLTGAGRDPVTHTPEYKVTAVRIEKI